jgi:hypothetical protein
MDRDPCGPAGDFPSSEATLTDPLEVVPRYCDHQFRGALGLSRRLKFVVEDVEQLVCGRHLDVVGAGPPVRC